MAGKLLYGWDDTNRAWIPLLVDANGYVRVDMSNINLDDLADVRVPAPADQNFLYWDDTAGEWTYRTLVDADIPGGIARDAEVAAAVAAHILSNLEIDAHKDWNNKQIRNINRLGVLVPVPTYPIHHVDGGATIGATIQSLISGLPGQGFDDNGMGILFDRNELTNVAYRGVCTITITGAGTYTNTTANKNILVNALGDFFTVANLNVTTVSIVLHFDAGALVENYGHVQWQPFLLTRLEPAAAWTYPQSIVAEVSDDNITWYKPATGWSTDDLLSVNLRGLWMGGKAQPTTPANLPGSRWRYARFTLTDFNIGTSNDDLWLTEVGFRHIAAPAARQFVNAMGDKMFGTLDVPSFRIRDTKTPATAGAAGTKGDICWDASYIYVCVDTDEWERAAIASW